MRSALRALGLQATLAVMLDGIDYRSGSFKMPLAIAVLALSMLTMIPDTGWPQAAPPASVGGQPPPPQTVPDQPAPTQVEPPPPAPPAANENPGLINEIGKLFEKSKSMLPTLKSPGETIDDLNTHAKGAGESLSNIAKPSSMVSGRAACLVAANGAPDCKAGADKLCQTKGFKEGNSLDTDAAEKCSAKVYLPGRKREPGDCKTENYVVKALCQ